jgi:hypothetical protein
MRRLVITAFLFCLLASCGDGSDPDTPDAKDAPTTSASTTSAPTPSKAAAEKFAKEAAARVSAQDYAGSWELWDSASKKQVSLDAYVKYGEACDIGGVPVSVDSVRMEGDNKATIRFEAAGFTQARTLIFENGAWSLKTTQDTLDLFSGGDPVANAKAAGGC